MNQYSSTQLPLSEVLPSSSARDAAKKMILDNHMIGVIFDRCEYYPFDDWENRKVPRYNSFDSHSQALRQDFCFDDHGKIISGEDVFQSKEAYEYYQRLSVEEQKKCIDQDPSKVFKTENLGKYYIWALAKQITLNPYDERIKKAREYIAEVISENVHPRYLRYAHHTGHNIICAATNNVAQVQALKHWGQSISAYEPYSKTIVVTNPSLNWEKLKNSFPHELGHMMDFHNNSSLFLEKHLDNDSEIRVKIKNDLDHLRRLEDNLSVDGSAIQELVNLARKRTKNFDLNELRNVLSLCVMRLDMCLPASDRQNRENDNNYQGIDEQIAEIPAIISQVSGPYGMRFAKKLMPELYEAVWEVNKSNPKFRVKPATAHAR